MQNYKTGMYKMKTKRTMILMERMVSDGEWLFRRRSFLPLVVLAVGLAECALEARETVLADFLHTRGYEYLCLAVSLSGLLVRIVTVGHTPVGTSGRNTAGQVADSLNVTGMYSIVRHPLYLGNFLMYLGLAFLTRSMGFAVLFVLAFWLYYERVMLCEERFLRDKYGEEYLSWVRRTPAFIPRVGGYVPPVLGFSWKKVLKKEKNGVFAILAVYCLFDVVWEWSSGRREPDVVLWLLAGIAGMAYMALKMIKRHTGLLDEPGR